MLLMSPAAPEPIRAFWVAVEAPDLRTSAQTKLQTGTKGCVPRGPFPSLQSLYGLKGQAPRSRCSQPLSTGRQVRGEGRLVASEGRGQPG